MQKAFHYQEVIICYRHPPHFNEIWIRLVNHMNGTYSDYFITCDYFPLINNDSIIENIWTQEAFKI